MFELDMLRPMLEMTVVIPGAFLCFLPTKAHLRIPVRQLIGLGIPFLLLWAIVGGLICYTFRWSNNVWLFPWLVGFGLFLRWAANLPGWKTASLLLAVCGMFSCLTNLATTADILLAPENSLPWFTFPAIAVYLLLHWALVACLWYPDTHAISWLLYTFNLSGTRYVFWMLPLVFLALNIYIQPLDYDTLHTDRMLVVYLVMVALLLALFLLLYLLFYRMARELDRGMQLARDNEILQQQAAQYQRLQKNMEDTRRARHDLRQHFIALRGCLDSGDLQAVSAYVSAHLQSLPSDSPQVYCKNLAVNAVLDYYAVLAGQQKIDCKFSVQMDEETLIPEPEFCVLLGNLLENALEACAKIQGDRRLHAALRQLSKSRLMIVVENTSEPPQWEAGSLRSSKRPGAGFGAQSVKMIAERYHGGAQFSWQDGIFRAFVLLNP